MKYYLLAAVFVILTPLAIIFIPLLSSVSEKALASTQTEVPSNSAQVLGVQKYNLPPSAKGLVAPQFSARSILVKDLGTDTVLYQKYPDLRVPIASTTKIMTALVGSEYYKDSDVLVASSSAGIGGSVVGLVPGEKLSFRSLLYGMLLNSGNDAAFDIAENYPGGVSGFVAAMNQKAHNLGLLNTQFDNPAGFDSLNHYSSAGDLALMTEEALKNPELARVVATKETVIESLDKEHVHQLVNLNKLLSSVPGVIGVKTGSTPAAKENLVGLVERGGHRVLTVVLGSDDRFGETSTLIEWAFNNYEWQ